MTCPHVRGLGVFVLGSQDTEREAAARHIASCLDCQAELAELQGLPALLATVRGAGIDLDEAPVRRPDDLLDRVLVTIAAERAGKRGRRRRTVLLAAVALVVVAAAGTGVAFRAGPGFEPERVPLAASRSAFGVSATTSVLGRPWGTQVDMTLSGLPAGSSCRLVARAADGRTETAASWQVTYRDSLTVEGMTSIAPDDLTELEVVDDNGRRLITVAVTSVGGTPR
jgi:hypothetical protein